MADFDYAGIQTIAHGLLADFGGGEKALTFRRKTQTPSSYSATTGQITVTETTYTVTGVIVSLSPHDLAALGLTISDARRIVISAKDLSNQPEPGDEVDFQGHTWRVIDSSRAQPAGVNLVYQVTVRRA